jgi:hypothetical protein
MRRHIAQASSKVSAKASLRSRSFRREAAHSAYRFTISCCVLLGSFVTSYEPPIKAEVAPRSPDYTGGLLSVIRLRDRSSFHRLKDIIPISLLLLQGGEMSKKQKIASPTGCFLPCLHITYYVPATLGRRSPSRPER